MTDNGLPSHCGPHEFARNIAKGEQKRRDTNYDEIEARILAKLKKLPSYDLDWVECMINHLIARTQQPPEPPRMDERPDLIPATREPFKGTEITPVPLGGAVKFLPDCRFQYKDGSIVKCNRSESEHFQGACSKRCKNPERPLRSEE